MRCAGAVYGHYISFIGPQDFDFMKSLIIICMVILGGMDSIPGVITGAIFLTLIDEKLRAFFGFQDGPLRGDLLITLLTRPEGMIPRTVRDYRFAFSLDKIKSKSPDLRHRKKGG